MPLNLFSGSVGYGRRNTPQVKKIGPRDLKDNGSKTIALPQSVIWRQQPLQTLQSLGANSRAAMICKTMDLKVSSSPLQ